MRFRSGIGLGRIEVNRRGNSARSFFCSLAGGLLFSGDIAAGFAVVGG
jgi:hypothetical protein